MEDIILVMKIIDSALSECKYSENVDAAEGLFIEWAKEFGAEPLEAEDALEDGYYLSNAYGDERSVCITHLAARGDEID